MRKGLNITATATEAAHIFHTSMTIGNTMLRRTGNIAIWNTATATEMTAATINTIIGMTKNITDISAEAAVIHA